MPRTIETRLTQPILIKTSIYRSPEYTRKLTEEYTTDDGIHQWLAENSLHKVENPSHDVNVGYVLHGANGVACLILPRQIDEDKPRAAKKHYHFQLDIKSQPADKDLPSELTCVLSRLKYEKVSD